MHVRCKIYFFSAGQQPNPVLLVPQDPGHLRPHRGPGQLQLHHRPLPRHLVGPRLPVHHQGDHGEPQDHLRDGHLPLRRAGHLLLQGHHPGGHGGRHRVSLQAKGDDTAFN